MRSSPALRRAEKAFAAGDYASVARECEAALRVDATLVQAWLWLAIGGLNTGAFGRSAEAAGKVVALAPKNALGHKILGAARARLGDAAAALKHFVAAAMLDGADKEAQSGVAAALNDLGECARALAVTEGMIQICPDYAPGHYNRGVALAGLGRTQEAIDSYRLAIARRPDFVEALNNCGALLAQARRDAEAISLFDRVLALNPDFAPAHANRGRALVELGRDEEALASCAKALALNPHDAETSLTRVQLLLATGRMAEGLVGLELRRRRPDWRERHFDAPEWREGPAAGKNILLWAEQGLGDTLQFCRYAGVLAARGATVTLAVQPALRRLLADLPDVRVAALDETPEAHDLHAPLMSAPRLLGLDETNLFVAPPRLKRDAPRVARWRARLDPELFHIGVAWQGNPAGEIDRGRSFPLAALAPLAAVPRVKLWSLQKNAGAEQIRALAGAFAIEDLGPDFDAGPDAFLDTAALMASLDLVVTSDTAAAHLAGTLGRPVWIALQVASEWRWLRDREDSPFYPSARLFRQRAPGDWGDVFSRMGEALASAMG